MLTWFSSYFRFARYPPLDVRFGRESNIRVLARTNLLKLESRSRTCPTSEKKLRASASLKFLPTSSAVLKHNVRSS
jgi:hypothetical protein